MVLQCWVPGGLLAPHHPGLGPATSPSCLLSHPCTVAAITSLSPLSLLVVHSLLLFWLSVLCLNINAALSSWFCCLFLNHTHLLIPFLSFFSPALICLLFLWAVPFYAVRWRLYRDLWLPLDVWIISLSVPQETFCRTSLSRRCRHSSKGGQSIFRWCSTGQQVAPQYPCPLVTPRIPVSFKSDLNSLAPL